MHPQVPEKSRRRTRTRSSQKLHKYAGSKNERGHLHEKEREAKKQEAPSEQKC